MAFPGAAAAVRCAVSIQRRLNEHRRTHGFAPLVRIGLHTAEATEAQGDYTGKGVHEAARIAALADGEEIVASGETLHEVGSVAPVSRYRSVTLKGLAEPMAVASVDWR